MSDQKILFFFFPLFGRSFLFIAVSPQTALKQPNAIKLGKKNNKILPFEEEGALEFLGHKNDASLFMLGTSNKKRPDNIVMGRLFDFHVLDMVEFGVLNLRPTSSFKAPAPGVGMRPCFVFCGDEFEQNPTIKRLGNLFLDFFGGRTTNMVNLRGLENVIVLTAVAGVVHFRHYTVALQKSSERFPRVELEEVGPSFEMRVGRSKLATEEQWRQSTVADPRLKVSKSNCLFVSSLTIVKGSVKASQECGGGHFGLDAGHGARGQAGLDGAGAEEEQGPAPVGQAAARGGRRCGAKRRSRGRRRGRARRRQGPQKEGSHRARARRHLNEFFFSFLLDLFCGPVNRVMS